MLQHLLGEDVTVPPERGLFLAETWRLRPELCAFTSDAYYEGRLGYAPEAARRSLALGNGPAWIPVEHEGHGQSSPEEVDAIAAAIAGLLGTPFTDEDGETRPLAGQDVLVVAPYNAQVRMLRSRLPEDVARRDRRQVPGAAGAGRLRLDGELDDGERAAGCRLRVRPAPLQRRDVARTVPRRAGLRAAAPRRRLQDRRADAARQRRVPLRRARRHGVSRRLRAGDLPA